MENSKIIYKAENLKKSFLIGKGKRVEVLKGLNFEIKEGEFVIIFGPSGSGKSTLLHILVGLEPPTEGRVYFRGKDIYSLSDDERANLREKEIGMLYQQPIWIRSLNVLENVAFPLILQGYERKKAFPLALSYLAQNKMEAFKDYYPQELSGGEQQKVALARGTVINPPVLIADEPTGNLDQDSGKELMHLLTLQNKSFQRTIIMVTHELSFLDYAKRVIRMIDGKIVADFYQ
jgi:putative ABC transport system ATP-binding protein